LELGVIKKQGEKLEGDVLKEYNRLNGQRRELLAELGEGLTKSEKLEFKRISRRYGELHQLAEEKGITKFQERERGDLTRLLENPYMPSLIILATSAFGRNDHGSLDYVFSRYIGVINDQEDNRDYLEVLIAAAEGTMGKGEKIRGVNFHEIDYNVLARASKGFSHQQLKDLHIQVMESARAAFASTRRPQRVTTESYLEELDYAKRALLDSGEKRREIGFVSTWTSKDL